MIDRRASAVIGHTELVATGWVAAPPSPGEIVYGQEYQEQVGGGPAIAAVAGRLAMGETVLFFTAVGNDAAGEQCVDFMRSQGVEVQPTIADTGTNRVMSTIDALGERGIAVFGDLDPDGSDTSLHWEALKQVGAVYFERGNKAARMAAREAPLLVVPSRALPLVKEVGVVPDVLIRSQNDPAEQPGQEFHLDKFGFKPRVIITTNGSEGGSVLIDDEEFRYDAVPIADGDFEDSYGCGDSFGGAFTAALAEATSRDLELKEAVLEALPVAARAGADAAMRRGPFGAPLVSVTRQ